MPRQNSAGPQKREEEAGKPGVAGKPASEKKPASAGKPRKVRGYVVVDVDRCKGCGFCIAFCPPHVLEFHSDYNPHGYHFPHLVNPDGCTGCDLCGLYCPDFAIHGVMIKDGVRESPGEEKG